MSGSWFDIEVSCQKCLRTMPCHPDFGQMIIVPVSPIQSAQVLICYQCFEVLQHSGMLVERCGDPHCSECNPETGSQIA